MISGDLEDAVCYFTAFVRDEYLPGLGIKDADPIVPMEILFEMRKCQALELAQAGRKDHASQIFAEFIVPLLENYDLAFGGDSMKIGVELAKCISYSKEKLVEIFGNSAERRKELLSLVQHKLFRVPRISRALYFSKKVANMNIMGLLTKSTGEIADTQTIKVGFEFFFWSDFFVDDLMNSLISRLFIYLHILNFQLLSSFLPRIMQFQFLKMVNSRSR
jgi:hypothetical protein